MALKVMEKGATKLYATHGEVMVHYLTALYQKETSKETMQEALSYCLDLAISLQGGEIPEPRGPIFTIDDDAVKFHMSDSPGAQGETLAEALAPTREAINDEETVKKLLLLSQMEAEGEECLKKATAALGRESMLELSRNFKASHLFSESFVAEGPAEGAEAPAEEAEGQRTHSVSIEEHVEGITRPPQAESVPEDTLGAPSEETSTSDKVEDSDESEDNEDSQGENSESEDNS